MEFARNDEGLSKAVEKLNTLSLVDCDPNEFFEMAEACRKGISASMLPELFAAFQARKDTIERVELVDMVGLLISDESTQFLRMVVRGRYQPLPRYYAARSLIERGDRGWISARRQSLKLEFYQSLLAYEAYVKGEISLPRLDGLARERTRWRGDHWEWLTHLEGG
jgi:hypothetical protein